MNKRYYSIALLVCLILLLSACKRSGSSTGGAPRTPFLGGTAGVTINFEKDSPPPEVTDDESFSFNAIVQLKNDGETKIDKNDIKLKLVGFDPSDFSSDFESVSDVQPDDNLEPRKIAQNRGIKCRSTPGILLEALRNRIIIFNEYELSIKELSKYARLSGDIVAYFLEEGYRIKENIKLK